MAKGMLVVISGPSGVGKGTVCARLLEKDKRLMMSVSATTRPPRKGEKDGVNYFFKTVEEFEDMIARGEFLEYMRVFGSNYYGTPAEYVKTQLEKGNDVLLEIDVQGASRVKQVYPDALMIFLLPPSKASLKERLLHRGTEAPEALERRFLEADSEMDRAREYDYVVVNDNLDTAVNEILSILEAKRKELHSLNGS